MGRSEFPVEKIHIQNLTAKRIGIAPVEADVNAVLFVLPPFGKRNLLLNELKSIDYEPWEKLNLITIESIEKDSIVKLFFGFIKNWSLLILSLFIILAIGYAIPAVIIFVFNKGLFTPAYDSWLLGRGLQWGFIGMASTLPALLYLYGFGQFRDNILQDIIRLDPRIITMDDAKSLYENKIIRVYGSERFSNIYSQINAWLPIYIFTFVITAGWIFTLQPFGEFGDCYSDYFLPEKALQVFGFLGAYFFVLNYLFRRYLRADLKPKTYSYATFRILTVIILLWVLDIIFNENFDNVLLPLAFMIGIFPDTAIIIIKNYLNPFRLYGIKFKQFGLMGEDSLKNLDGVNIYHQVQLMEEGVENIESLAHHGIVDLMLQSNLPVASIVDWKDQAILHLYIRSQESLKVLYNYGIRTATDMEKVYIAAINRNQDEELLAILGDENQPIKKYQLIMDMIRDEEWMPFIRHWRNNIHLTNKIFTIDEMNKEFMRMTEMYK